jgi:ABC-type proline/glycine betaine transport system ATPase subunit
MQKGKIIEQGNHEHLLREFPEGLYSKFVKEQEQSEVSGTKGAQAQLIEEETPFEDVDNVKRDISFKLKTSVIDRELEKVEKQMKTKYDEIDEVKDKDMEKTLEKIKNGSHLSRMISISKPCWVIFYATFVSILQGAVMPFFGIFIGRMLFVL